MMGNSEMKSKTIATFYFVTKSVAYAIGMSAWLIYAFLSWIWWLTGREMAVRLELGTAETYLYQFRGIISELPILILATYTMFLVEKAWHNIIGMLILLIALPEHFVVNVFYHDETWNRYWYLVTTAEILVYGLAILMLRRLAKNDTSGWPG